MKKIHAPEAPTPKSGSVDRKSAPLIGFPTVFQRVDRSGVEALNAQLLEEILAEEQNGENFSNSVSVLGGFHSAYDFLERDNPAVRELKSMISEDMREYLASYWHHNSRSPLQDFSQRNPKMSMHLWGWAVVQRENDVVLPHTHPGCHLSGVYYVAVPTSESTQGTRGGHLMLTDPRAGAAMQPIPNQSTAFEFKPEPGLAVLFPSHIQHYTTPVKGKGERVCVSFNVTITGIGQ